MKTPETFQGFFINRKTNISTGKRTYQPENEHINRKTNISTEESEHHQKRENFNRNWHRKQLAERPTQSKNFIKKRVDFIALILYHDEVLNL